MTNNPAPQAGNARGTPRFLLQAEGLAILIAATVSYGATGQSWWLFAALLLVPDLFMLGYLHNPRTGAALYNLGHTYVVPLILLGAGYLSQSNAMIGVALIWVAHIGMDRAIGYGLKYNHSFKATHLSDSSEPARIA